MLNLQTTDSDACFNIVKNALVQLINVINKEGNIHDEIYTQINAVLNTVFDVRVFQHYTNHYTVS